LPYDLCNIIYSTTIYMNFCFNTSMNSICAKKYYILVCFHPHAPIHIILLYLLHPISFKQLEKTKQKLKNEIRFTLTLLLIYGGIKCMQMFCFSHVWLSPCYIVTCMTCSIDNISLYAHDMWKNYILCETLW
jgi:hypothetical protein